MLEKIKEMFKLGQIVYYAYDDRPIDGCGVLPAEVIEIHEDHMILKDEYSNLWIDYEDFFSGVQCSCGVFLTEKEAKDFLGI